jgi:clan AA aspartic protease
MITGVVTPNREAVIRVAVRGTHGQETQVDTVVDTGFNGFLTLPVQRITDLALSFAGTTQATLGDGSAVPLDIFEATVIRDNHEQSIPVLAAEGSALVGMALLSGYRVTFDVEDGGSVSIEALS